MKLDGSGNNDQCCPFADELFLPESLDAFPWCLMLANSKIMA